MKESQAKVFISSGSGKDSGNTNPLDVYLRHRSRNHPSPISLEVNGSHLYTGVCCCLCGLLFLRTCIVSSYICCSCDHANAIKRRSYLRAELIWRSQKDSEPSPLTRQGPLPLEGLWLLISVSNNLSERGSFYSEASIESRSEHPIAEAIVRKAKEAKLLCYESKI